MENKNEENNEELGYKEEQDEEEQDEGEQDEEEQDNSSQEEDEEEQSSENVEQLKSELEKYKGIAKRYETKLKKQKQEKSERKQSKSNQTEQSDEFDYGQKAFLVAKGFETNEEIKYLENIVNKTGESLEEVIEDEFVQNKLKSIKENKKNLKALPKKGKRGQPSSAENTVDYWLKKGELPPKEQTEMRRKVVNAKYRLAGGKKFSSTSIIDNANVSK